ncbi:MAG TPA: ATP-grasp domain-containing protein [Pirellulales bacterium]|nr:ATP-grasp domain-containing protein [Pirellulales bacterium]
MKIGLTYNVKGGAAAESPNAPGLAADAEEEFDSQETIDSIADAIRSLGHDVELLGDGETLLRKLLDRPRPELVVNIAEGAGSGRCREARVPAVLEMLGIAYTGSDPLTLAATLDKDCAKRLVQASGVSTPAWALIENGELDSAQERLASLPWPAFVKPAFEGSSKGVLAQSLVRTREELADSVERAYRAYRQPIMVEEFIDGDELTVGVVGHRPQHVLGIMRVLPQQKQSSPFVYSLEVKRDWERQVRYESPAQLSPADTAAVERAALAAWRALGCRDVSRFDFRLRDGVPYFLEVNPLPGLSPKTGDLVILARGYGVEYSELISRILNAAIERTGAST